MLRCVFCDQVLENDVEIEKEGDSYRCPLCGAYDTLEHFYTKEELAIESVELLRKIESHLTEISKELFEKCDSKLNANNNTILLNEVSEKIMNWEFEMEETNV